ncbi:Gfo/Idh/MocA family protein [Pseudoalteromonas spongiae]|uniref:Gfo/Idh/MocA family oxidoreductase n=1 Tax=Pseudoalteromonas spongiae TaxID=298657 RepID=A0ABU8ERN6_9GAMM
MLTVLCIGFGNIAKRHIHNLNGIKPISKLCVVRKSHQKESIADVKDVRFFQSIDEIPDSIIFDFALICSPSSAHLHDMVSVKRKGIRFFVEKPLLASANEIVQLDDLLGNENLPVVGYNLLYTRGFQKIAALLKQKTVGDIWQIDCKVGQYLPDWRSNKPFSHTASANASMGGGALLELSHELNYLLELFKFNSLTIQANLMSHSSLKMDCENQVDILCKAILSDKDNPVSMHINLNMLSRNATRYLTIEGTMGSLYWDLVKQVIEIKLFDQTAKIVDVSEDTNIAYKHLMYAALDEQGSGLKTERFDKAKKTMQWIEWIRIAAREKKQMSYDLTW